jgi:DNA-binding response OmpR family regulator
MSATDRSPFLAEARVLVLANDPLVRELVRLTLNHGVFVTMDVSTPADATRAMARWQPHVAIVDMDLAGSELLSRLDGDPAAGTRVPVVGLTRRADLRAMLAAFEQGVDDIMAVPFSSEELLARVAVVIRRTSGHNVTTSPVLVVHELELDLANHTVRIGGHDLHLTALEQSLLYLLATNPGQLITRDQILDALWGSNYVAESNVVDRHVRNLRAKLRDDYRNPQYIATVPGQGYRFITPAA